MTSEEKLIQGLKLVVEAFAEMIRESKNTKSNNEEESSDKTFKLNEAAEYLQIARSRLYTLARAGKIKHFRAGNKYLFRKKALDEWLEQELENSIKKKESQNSYGIIRKVKE